MLLVSTSSWAPGALPLAPISSLSLLRFPLLVLALLHVLAALAWLQSQSTIVLLARTSSALSSSFWCCPFIRTSSALYWLPLLPRLQPLCLLYLLHFSPILSPCFFPPSRGCFLTVATLFCGVIYSRSVSQIQLVLCLYTWRKNKQQNFVHEIFFFGEKIAAEIITFYH